MAAPEKVYILGIAVVIAQTGSDEKLKKYHKMKLECDIQVTSVLSLVAILVVKDITAFM